MCSSDLKKHGLRVILDKAETPHFAIWSKPGAAFVCLEPWYSFDDSIMSDKHLINKPGILCLEKDSEFSTGYSIRL